MNWLFSDLTSHQYGEGSINDSEPLFEHHYSHCLSDCAFVALLIHLNGVFAEESITIFFDVAA